MANILKGTNVAFKINDAAGTERDMSAFWVGGMPELGFESVDVTAFGDIARRNNPGLETNSWSVSLQPSYSGTAEPWYVFSSLLASNSTVTTAKFYPLGDASTRPEILFQVRVMNITHGGDVGGVETIDVELAQDGTRTVGTV